MMIMDLFIQILLIILYQFILLNLQHHLIFFYEMLQFYDQFKNLHDLV